MNCEPNILELRERILKCVHPDAMQFLPLHLLLPCITDLAVCAKTEGRNIETELCPRLENILFAFSLNVWKTTKCIIIGEDPYPDRRQARGISFACGYIKSRSLGMIFSALDSCGIYGAPPIDLSTWCDQGVLLLNTYLTVFQKIGSVEPTKHRFWLPFSQGIVRMIFARSIGIPEIALWGNHAKESFKIIVPPEYANCIHMACHPVERSGRFNDCTSFKSINKNLIDRGLTPIIWGLPGDAPITEASDEANLNVRAMLTAGIDPYDQTISCYLTAHHTMRDVIALITHNKIMIRINEPKCFYEIIEDLPQNIDESITRITMRNRSDLICEFLRTTKRRNICISALKYEEENEELPIHNRYIALLDITVPISDSAITRLTVEDYNRDTWGALFRDMAKILELSL